jgi:formamidopyrimidine-DNA glycosylase
VPELPEVEASRRLLAAALQGQTLTKVEAHPDTIVLGSTTPEAIAAALTGRRVLSVHRHGKYFWLSLEDGPDLMGHLGMSGAVLDLTPGHQRGVNYRRTKSDFELERPRFLKLWLEAEDRRVAIVDGRRLARLWLSPRAQDDPRLRLLGPDALDACPPAEDLAARFARRKTPIKALLLDQSALAGIGNYLADEVLFQAGIAPARIAASLTPEEWDRLQIALTQILRIAVDAEADYEQFPPEWLFHVRWGGSRGAQTHDGCEIVREKIGGRTTAWVPVRQK